MNKHDYKNFSDFWNLIQEQLPYSKPLSRDAMGLVFSMLEELDFNDIKRAARHHCDNSKEPLSVYAIKQILNPSSASLHCDADEAWSIALQAMDEDNCVCTTSEIIEAMDVAKPLYNPNNDTGARMAFRAAYTRIVKTATRPNWFMSVGNNKDQAEGIAAHAVKLGRLPTGTEAKYRIEKSTMTMQKLITATEEHNRTASVTRQNLDALKASLKQESKEKPPKEQLTDAEYNALPWYMREHNPENALD